VRNESDYCALPLTEWARLNDELAEARAERDRLRDAILTRGWWRESPCVLCGYTGPGYYQPETHVCAGQWHDALKRTQP
jgi:hypothetical protein